MDEIVAALVAGAGAGVAGATSTAVGDAYRALKNLLRHRFADRPEALQALDADETEPSVWQARLGPYLAETGAAQDEQVLAAARLLLAAESGTAARLTISVQTNEGAIGEFHDRVVFDRRTQVPPTRPAAE